MSDSTEAPSDDPRANRGSPLPGCLILVTILVVFGGLAVLYLVVGLYQTRTIGTFTTDAPIVYDVTTPDAAAAEEALAKLKQIGEAVSSGKDERILFTADDLNVLIATLDVAEGFRGNTHVVGIEPSGIIAEMSLPLRKGIFDKGFRYLNATFVLQPELRARTIAFKVLDIDSSTGEVPRGFIDNYSVLDLFRLDPENEALKANVSSLAAVYTEADLLVIETKVGK